MVTQTLRTVPGILCLPAIFSRQWRAVVPGSASNGEEPLAAPWTDFAWRLEHPRELIDTIAARTPEVRALGWKHHLALDAALTGWILDQPDIRPVLLERENLLASYSSDLIVRATGRNSLSGEGYGTQHRCAFDAADFDAYCRRRQAVMQRWAPRLDGACRITYGGLRRGDDFARLLAFLDAAESSYTVPTVKQNSDDILSRFLQPEDVAEHLRRIGRESWASE